ncbi:HNH endonuclease [Rhodanobacter terrae]|uniref:HNH endonuclease n=1 Tax=Rhodanobacter terrae TaxID=418647 RepID=A0ABW0SU67_9GAMM
MSRNIYHKFEIIEQSPTPDGWIVGVDPIDLAGAFGLSDEIYVLLCKLSTCVVCGERTEALEHHRACVRDLDPITDYRRGVAFTRAAGKLGFLIPRETYREQFSPVYDRGWQDRQRSTRAYRRARNGGSYTVKDVCELLKSQQHRCYYCFTPFGENGEGGYHFHRDHMQPLAGGGTDNIGNIVLTCAACNMDKGQEDWDSFLSRRMQRVLASDQNTLIAIHRQVAEWKSHLPTRRPNALAWDKALAIDGHGPSLSANHASPEPHLKLSLDFVPFQLVGDNLRYRIGPKRWENLATAVMRAAAYTCSICRHQVCEEEAHSLLAYEEWVYAHIARPATARLQSIRCVCSKCCTVLHFDETREKVTAGQWKESQLDDAITQFCRINASDAGVLNALDRCEMDLRRKNMHVFYELAWGRFEPLLGKRIRQEHEFTITDHKLRRSESHEGPGYLIGNVPLPIPDGWSTVHVVPLFDATRISGMRKNTLISEMLPINGELGHYGKLSAQAWRGRKFGEYRDAAERELARIRGRK